MFKISSTPIYIDYLELENIQNYKKRTVFKLSRRLTVFLARNSTGKTTIGRAISLFSHEHSDSALRGILRNGTESGFVRLYLSDGTNLGVTLTRVKRKNKPDVIETLYSYCNGYTGEELRHWRFYSKEILKILNWVVLETKDEDYFVNISTSDKRLFLNTSGSVNAQVVESLCRNELLESNIERLSKAIEMEKQVLQSMDKDAEAYETKMKACPYTDISYMEQVQDYYKALKERLQILHLQVKTYSLLQSIEEEQQKSTILNIAKTYIRTVNILRLLVNTVDARHQLNLDLLLKAVVEHKLISRRLEDVAQCEVSAKHLNTLHNSLSHLSNKARLQGAVQNYEVSISYLSRCNQLANLVQEKLVAKSLRNIISIDNRIAILKTTGQLMVENWRKGLINNYQATRASNSGYTRLSEITKAKMKADSIKQVLKADTSYRYCKARTEVVQKVGVLTQASILTAYLLQLNIYKEALLITASNIPTCPTCGKALLPSPSSSTVSTHAHTQPQPTTLTSESSNSQGTLTSKGEMI